MTAPANPSAQLEQRISRWHDGDPEHVLENEALVEAAQLWWLQVADADEDVVNLALHLLARLHWARSDSGPQDQRQIEQHWALGFFHVLWQRNPIAPPPAIQEYFKGAKLPIIEDPTAHAREILWSIATHALSRHRDTGIRLFALVAWPLDLTEDAAPGLLKAAMALASRHAEIGNTADLDAAVTYGERALHVAAEPNLLRAKVLQNVGALYLRQFETTSSMSDIDQSMALTNEALTITQSLCADPGELLANLSGTRWRRFVAFQHLDDLRQAAADGTAAVEALPPGSPASATVRAHTARLSQLLLLHPDTPEAVSPEHIITLRADLASATGDTQATHRAALGVALAARFEQSRRIEDLQEAIALFRAVEPGSAAPPLLLAGALWIRFNALGEVADLDECISQYRDAWNSATQTFEQVSVAESLAKVLEADYQFRPDPARLRAAIDVGRTVVLLAWPDPTAPEPDPGLLPALESLAYQNLRRRLRAAGRTGDHDFVLSDEAMTDAAYLWWLAHRLTSRDPASSSLARARGALGDFHILRHNAKVGSGRPDEMAQTLMHWLSKPTRVPENLPEPLDRMLGPHAAPEWQTRYANTLIKHALQNRNLAVVNTAILLLSAAIEATGPDDPELSERLGRLSAAYLIRGLNHQDTVDLDLAVQLAAEALALAPPNATEPRERLAYARNLRMRRAQRTATPDPIQDRVVSVAIPKESVDGPDGAAIAAAMDAAVQESLLTEQDQKPTTDGHSRRFLQQSRHDGLAVSLELALLAAEAETIRHEDPIKRIGHLGHLHEIRLERHLLTQENAELAEAARLLEEALNLAPRVGPLRGPVLRGLTQIYNKHSELTSAQLERLCDLTRTMITHSMDSLTALRDTGRLAMRYQRYDLAVTCYREAVALMRPAALEEIDRVDRAARLTQITKIGSEAVTAHILAGDPTAALEAAEESRAVLLSLELDLRSDLSNLRDTHPDLAERFDRLRQTITTDRTETALHPEGYVRVARASQNRDAWTNLLDDIRTLTSHESFLRPPAAAELTALELSGPIVLVNVSPFGSHALIVGPEPAVHALPLDGLNHQDVRSHAYNLLSDADAGVTSEVLTWLWDTVVGPVLKDTQASRVWWVPTGLLSAFPLHAATASDGRSALDLVESSYAPTIRLLARSVTRGAVPEPGGDLIVAVRRTANGDELPGAESEGQSLTERLPQAVALINDRATRERVLAELPTVSRVHFACHNVRDDTHPHLSGLGLSDGLLTIDDLSHLDLPNADFAQLSACATVMPTPDAPDELTHLAAAFQVAGFRSVVATLWPVHDLVAADFSQLFHDAGGHHTASAAVAAASRALRDRHPHRPDLWAPYLHYGV